MTIPMPEIRQTIQQARDLAAREGSDGIAAGSGLLVRLVQILDLYVGYEPTLAEEAEYVRGEIERRDTAITEALRLLESAPEAFTGASQNIGAAAEVLRHVGSEAAGVILPALAPEESCTGFALNGVHTQVFHCRQTGKAHEVHLWRTGLEWFTCRGEAR